MIEIMGYVLQRKNVTPWLKSWAMYYNGKTWPHDWNHGLCI